MLRCFWRACVGSKPQAWSQMHAPFPLRDSPGALGHSQYVLGILIFAALDRGKINCFRAQGGQGGAWWSSSGLGSGLRGCTWLFSRASVVSQASLFVEHRW